MDHISSPPAQIPTSLPSAADTFPRGGASRGGGTARRWPLALIGLGLLANAALMLWNRLSPTFPTELTFDSRAFGQAGPGGAGTAGSGTGGPGGGAVGIHGFYMMPAQLGTSTWGLYIMDVESGTVCVYRANPESSRFKLMAVRYFRNDRFLSDFNNDSPTPKEVLKQVEQQRQREQIEGPGTGTGGGGGGAAGGGAGGGTEKKDAPRP